MEAWIVSTSDMRLSQAKRLMVISLLTTKPTDWKEENHEQANFIHGACIADVLIGALPPRWRQDNTATVSASYSTEVVASQVQAYGQRRLRRQSREHDKSSLTAMTPEAADGSGNFTASVTTGTLGTLSDYAYCHDLEGTNVAKDTSIEGSTVTYTATIVAVRAAASQRARAAAMRPELQLP